MRFTGAAAVIGMVLFAGLANAQMMGGGRVMGPGGTSGSYGTMGSMVGMGEHRGLIVDGEGTVFAVRVVDPTATNPAQFEVVAVRPSGTIAWVAPLSAGMTFLRISNGQLLVTSSPHGTTNAISRTPAPPGSTLMALSTASGSALWSLTLDGQPFDLEPFPGGTYVTVVKPSATGTGGMMNGRGSLGTRVLLAVGTDGSVLWSVPLSR